MGGTTSRSSSSSGTNEAVLIHQHHIEPKLHYTDSYHRTRAFTVTAAATSPTIIHENSRNQQRKNQPEQQQQRVLRIIPSPTETFQTSPSSSPTTAKRRRSLSHQHTVDEQIDNEGTINRTTTTTTTTTTGMISKDEEDQYRSEEIASSLSSSLLVPSPLLPSVCSSTLILYQCQNCLAMSDPKVFSIDGLTYCNGDCYYSAAFRKQTEEEEIGQQQQQQQQQRQLTEEEHQYEDQLYYTEDHQAVVNGEIERIHQRPQEEMRAEESNLNFLIIGATRPSPLFSSF